MKTVVAHVEKIEAELKQWAVKLDELMAKAGQATAETKAEYRLQLQDLKAKHRIAQTKLGELKASHKDRWDTFTSGVEGAWRDFEVAFQKLLN
jgi:ElaB/YqjD/DUF883 family membrane-anchored ribosome-binding protein